MPHSPSTGVDLLSGQGLPEALKGADVVVNLTNSHFCQRSQISCTRSSASLALLSIRYAIPNSRGRRLVKTAARHRDIGGINYMAPETCFGDMTKEEALQSAELLATEVMPYFA